MLPGLTSQTATTCTPASFRKALRLAVPLLPTPIEPMTMRLLGATAPFLPRAEAGMMAGSAREAPIAVARLMKARRLRLHEFMVYHPFQANQTAHSILKKIWHIDLKLSIREESGRGANSKSSRKGLASGMPQRV